MIFNSLIRYIKVSFIKFKSYIVPICIYTSYCSCPRSNSEVEYSFSFVCIGLNEVFYKCYWLLSWVNVFCFICIRELNYCSWILHFWYITSLIKNNWFSKCSSWMFLFPSPTPLFSYSHFWIINTLFFIEYAYVFVASHRLFLCHHWICNSYFIPYPIILILFDITHSQSRRKWLTSKQYYSTVWFYDSFEFFPHRLERDHLIPRTFCSSVRYICNNTIYRSIRNPLHSFKTILVEYLV